MLRIVSICVLALAGIVLVANADRPAAQMDMTATVQERQDLMKSMGRSFGPIVAILKGESTDFEAASAAASDMSATAVKLKDLFPAGTAAGEAEGSRAKPEIWTDNSEFVAAMDALIAESAALSKVATDASADTFGAQFQKLATACGGCHEGPAKAGGKFRVAKE